MKILQYELKIKAKAFLFWSITVVLLFVAGSMEFEGIAGANRESIEVVLNYYPPIILALMGITEAIDFSSLEGYTWVLGYFGTIIASFYAISLGSTVVNRELIDKTFEFLFTKPKRRSHILSIKIVSGFLCLTGFSIINLFSSIVIMNPLDQTLDISRLMFWSSVGTYSVSLLFYALSICVSTLAKNRGTSSKILNGFFLSSMIIGAIYDVSEQGEVIRILIPMRYFIYQDAQMDKVNGFYLMIVLVLSIGALVKAYKAFSKRDLTEL